MNKKHNKSLRFEYSWGYGDFRPRIDACGINGKTGWISMECKGVIFSGKCSKSLVNELIKLSK